MSPELAGQQREEIARGERFAFGDNWAAFLRIVDENRIAAAAKSFTQMLGDTTLGDQTFLDIGSGSGLSSLVARRLGANVTSFDYDPASVACTQELKRRFAADDPLWRVQQGSALDPRYMAALGQFDLVYSWGLLHHTGEMWRALELAGGAVCPGGRLFIAIYNDQGAWSRRWRRIKKLYCSGFLGRTLVTGVAIPYWVVRNLLADLVWMRNPFRRYRDYREDRGMSVVHDWIDWLGGFPFEVAKPEAILDFFRGRGFALIRLRTCGGSVGCNEFIFRRDVSR